MKHDRRIVIVGFMGCGKTTVSTALARRLGCKMIDLDSLITKSEGRSPAEIIQQDGEEAFRAIERRALQNALKNNEAGVIALGGGAWTIEANRALIAQHNCLTVWLDAPFDLCWRRIISSGHTIRPLAPDRESTRSLYKSRRRQYALVQLRLAIGEGDSAEGLAQQILTQT